MLVNRERVPVFTYISSCWADISTLKSLWLLGGAGGVYEQRPCFPGNQGMSCCLWENVLGMVMTPGGKSYLFVFLVVELLHPLSIPFPWHASINLYVKHSARSHQDDLTIVWNEKDKVQWPRANKCQENNRNIKSFGVFLIKKGTKQVREFNYKANHPHLDVYKVLKIEDEQLIFL